MIFGFPSNTYASKAAKGRLTKSKKPGKSIRNRQLTNNRFRQFIPLKLASGEYPLEEFSDIAEHYLTKVEPLTIPCE
jgi:hypothetical protein